jgi:predicted amidohydrolase YtcJ
MSSLLFRHGSVWTADPSCPRAGAVLTEGDRILRVGREVDVEGFATSETRIVDLGGGLVLPGFIDCHTHFLKGGYALSRIRLRDVTGRGHFAERVAAKVSDLEGGEWILDGHWDHEQFSPPGLPDKTWIDPVSPDNPVCVHRYDLHTVLVNSVALRIAGITKETVSPEGGEIQKDPRTGQPTGILRDAAVDLVTRHIPRPSRKADLAAAAAALRHAARRGVTSVHDMSDASSISVYRELLAAGRLTTRISVYLPIAGMDAFAPAAARASVDGDMVRIAGLKGFADGGLGSHSAYFFEPYADDPDTRGYLSSEMFPEGIMEERILKADAAEFQVAIHAIGDEANAIVLDIYGRVLARNGVRDRRWRIEHAQHLRPVEIARIARLGVIPSVQPSHAVAEAHWVEKRVGKERARTTYAFRSLLDGGGRLAFGSDWPVAPLDPLAGIHAAVTRLTADGENPLGWYPDQRIPLEEALMASTRNGARAEFMEHAKGSIEPGKLADLVVLDKDIFSLHPERIKDARVAMTVVGGRVVYDALSRS